MYLILTECLQISIKAQKRVFSIFILLNLLLFLLNLLFILLNLLFFNSKKFLPSYLHRVIKTILFLKYGKYNI